MAENGNGAKPATLKRRPIAKNRLAELRERNRKTGGMWLTATEMAKLRGTTTSMVSLHEAHKRPLTDKDVEEYSKILKVKPHKLFIGLTQNRS